MMTWPIIHIGNYSPEQLKNPDFQNACVKAYNAMKAKRAEVIEATLSVEGLLDMVLLDLFVARQLSQHRLRKPFEICSADLCRLAPVLRPDGEQVMFDIDGVPSDKQAVLVPSQHPEVIRLHPNSELCEQVRKSPRSLMTG